MKKILLCFLLLSALINSRSASADHIIGSDLTYRKIDSTHYAVRFVFYRDCNGCHLNQDTNYCGTTENCNSRAVYPQYLMVTGATGSCTGSLLDSVALTRQSIRDVTGACRTVANRCMKPCNSSFPFGVEEHVFTGVLDVSNMRSSGCCRVNLSISLSVRSAIITTGQQQSVFYTDAEMYICGEGNSSVVFANRPMTYACCNSPFSYSPAAMDTSDMDSISYHLVPVKTGATTNASYASGLSYTVPLPVYQPASCTQKSATANPPIGFNHDSTTGNLIFTPATNGCTSVGCPFVGLVSMEFREWRVINGTRTMVGRNRREMQLSSMSCAGNNPPTIGGTTSYSVCEGTQLCFNITSNDVQFVPPPPNTPQPPDTTQMSWTGGIKDATFSIIDSSARLKSARFCWTPKAGDAKTYPYTFSVIVRDNACPINAEASRTFKIQVKALPKATRSISYKACGRVVFSATPVTQVSSYNWLILDSAANPVGMKANLSQTTFQLDSVDFKVSGRYILKLTINNSSNCPVTYLDTIHYIRIHSIVSRDTAVCVGQPLTLGISVKDNDGAYSIKWNSNVADSFHNYTFTPYSTGFVNVSVSNQGCVNSKNISVKVTKEIRLRNDSLACHGSSIVLQPINLSAEHKRFSWSTGDTIKSILLTRPGSYILTVTDTLGCISDDTFNLSYHPHPLHINDTFLCKGAMLGQKKGLKTWIWLNGDTTAFVPVQNSGTYIVYAIDSIYNCGKHDTINVIADSVITAFKGKRTGFRTYVLDADYCSGCKYFWDFGDSISLMTLDTLTTHTYGFFGDFEVRLITSNLNGCSDTAYSMLDMFSTGKAGSGKNYTLLYPNPFSSQTLLEFYSESHGVLSIMAYDILGREYPVSQGQHISSGKNSFIIDSAELGLPEGMIMLRVQFNGSESWIKMLRVAD